MLQIGFTFHGDCLLGQSFSCGFQILPFRFHIANDDFSSVLKSENECDLRFPLNKIRLIKAAEWCYCCFGSKLRRTSHLDTFIAVYGKMEWIHCSMHVILEWWNYYSYFSTFYAQIYIYCYCVLILSKHTIYTFHCGVLNIYTMFRFTKSQPAQRSRIT